MSQGTRRVSLALSIAGCFGAGSLYGWSGYLPAVRAAFEVSNGAASMAFSLVLVSFTLGVLFGPVLLGRIAPGLRLPLLAGLAALALCAAALSTGFAGFVIAYGAVFGFASGALYNYAISVASASGAPTLFVPLSVAAFGLGGAIFGPVQIWLTAYGWGLWSSAPALACLIGVAGAAVALKPPSEPAGVMRPVHVVRPDKTLAVLWVIFAAGSCSGLIVIGFAAQILPQATHGVGMASLALFLATMGNALGRLSCALTVHLLGPARGVAASLTLSMVSLACLIFTTAPGMVVGLLFVVAFAYGQLAATMPLLVKSQVDDAAFSGSFGLVFTGWGVAGLIGPWSAGGLLDATGTLHIPLMACIALAGLGLWLALSFTKHVANAETR